MATKKKNSEPQPEKQEKSEKLGKDEHLPGPDFRQKVENTSVEDLQPDTAAPQQPYPTGSPPDPRETFHRMHGYYPPEEE